MRWFANWAGDLMFEQRLSRKRKTKAPCPGCFLHSDLCICDQIPRLDLKTKVTLVVHAKELKRTTNTGRLAILALVNSEMRVRGDDRNGMDLSELLSNDYNSLLFYPSECASELTHDLINESPKPVQLIVPDGNWRQASKVHYRHKELKGLKRVKISTPNTAQFRLRTEILPAGMATLEAIAHALRIIEGESVFEKLIAVYNAKLQQTLIGRGVAPEIGGTTPAAASVR